MRRLMQAVGVSKVSKFKLDKIIAVVVLGFVFWSGI